MTPGHQCLEGLARPLDSGASRGRAGHGLGPFAFGFAVRPPVGLTFATDGGQALLKPRGELWSHCGPSRPPEGTGSSGESEVGHGQQEKPALRALAESLQEAVGADLKLVPRLTLQPPRSLGSRQGSSWPHGHTYRSESAGTGLCGLHSPPAWAASTCSAPPRCTGRPGPAAGQGTGPLCPVGFVLWSPFSQGPCFLASFPLDVGA